MLAQKRRIVLCAVISLILTAFHVHAARVSLSWTAPTTNQNNTPLTDLAGYKVYHGFASRSYDVTTDVGLTTSAVLSGLEDGRTYYFAVTAYDTSGNQSLFTEKSYTTPLADTDGDGLTDDDERNIYHTDPNKADTDGDGINDGTEVAFWGANWNADPDGDGIINLLDPDSDDDDVLDGVERAQGTNPADPPSLPGTGGVLVAINAGGAPFTAAEGTSYQADTLFSGGNTHQTTAAIAGTTDDALYQSERFGNFSYNVPVANGDYVVTLKFAEIYFSSAGRRVFEVLMEGTKVVSNLDVFAQVGRNTAHDVTVSVRVTDGTLNITFRSLVDNAKVSAIAIKRPALNSDGDIDDDGLTDDDERNIYHTDPNKADTDGDGINDGTEVAFWGANWNADPDGDGIINLLDPDSDDDDVLDGVERAQGTNPADPPSLPGTGGVLVAINAGGAPFTAAEGTSYQADTLFSGGNTHQTTAAIAGTTDDALYQSERFGNFSYNVPVANGDYVVTLKFAEIYFSSAGRRVFEVLMEGTKVVSNLDVFAQVGRNTAHDVTVSVRVTDGTLNITFRSLVDNAKVSAIAIKRP